MARRVRRAFWGGGGAGRSRATAPAPTPPLATESPVLADSRRAVDRRRGCGGLLVVPAGGTASNLVLCDCQVVGADEQGVGVRRSHDDGRQGKVPAHACDAGAAAAQTRGAPDDATRRAGRERWVTPAAASGTGPAAADAPRRARRLAHGCGADVRGAVDAVCAGPAPLRRSGNRAEDGGEPVDRVQRGTPQCRCPRGGAGGPRSDAVRGRRLGGASVRANGLCAAVALRLFSRCLLH